MIWEIRWTRPAEKDLRRLDSSAERRVHDAVARLAETGQGDMRRLTGRDHEWRLRVGDHRVVMTLDASARVAVIHAVRHRSDVYRA
jgi:mRNA interferase RelE/StbE